jgi:hypothetical protein
MMDGRVAGRRDTSLQELRGGLMVDGMDGCSFLQHSM